MVIFKNPGLIDLEAVTTLGVSVKKDGAFGRFGTGVKYALATIMRHGGQVRIYRGTELHTLSTETKAIAGKEFNLVLLDGVSMNITTQFGRDWEPWMVLRELGCNALDEDGDFHRLDTPKDAEGNYCSEIRMPTEGPNVPEEDHTTIAVGWPALDTAFSQKTDLFLDKTKVVLFEDDRVRIMQGASAHLFYRGIRVYKTERPTLFTYDILKEQTLTEDRTLASSWGVDQILRDVYIASKDGELLRQILSADSHYHEATLDFERSSWGIKTSAVFIRTSQDLRERGKLNSPSAKRITVKHVRAAAEEESVGGGSYLRAKNDAFQYALNILEDIGLKFKDDQKFVMVPELEVEGALSILEGSTIFYTDALNQMEARKIAEELFVRWVGTQELYGEEQIARTLAPLFLNKSSSLKADEQLLKEDAALLQPKPSKEYILVGIWSGYTSAQEKVVYRELVDQEFGEKIGEFAVYNFADGTRLEITRKTRDVKSSGPIDGAMLGYSELVRKCVKTGIWDANKRDPEDSPATPLPAPEVVTPVGDEIPF